MRDVGEVCYADVFDNGKGIVEFRYYEDMMAAVKQLDGSRFRSHEVFKDSRVFERSYHSIKRCKLICIHFYFISRVIRQSFLWSWRIQVTPLHVSLVPGPGLHGVVVVAVTPEAGATLLLDALELEAGPDHGPVPAGGLRTVLTVAHTTVAEHPDTVVLQAVLHLVHKQI